MINLKLTRNSETLGTASEKLWRSSSLRLEPKRKALELTSSGKNVNISRRGGTEVMEYRSIKSIAGFSQDPICNAKSAKARYNYKDRKIHYQNLV